MHHGCSALLFTFSSLRIPMLACLQCICAGWKAWMMYRHHLIPTLKSLKEFLDKLSRRVVEFVFLEPENLKCVYRAAGETEMVATQTYCICQEGKCMPYYASSSQFVLNFTSPISRTPCKHLTAVVCRCSFWYFWYSVIVRHVLVRQIAVVLWSNAAATNAQCSGTIASALEARLLTSLTIGGAQTLVPNPEVTYIAFVNDQPLKILPWFNVS